MQNKNRAREYKIMLQCHKAGCLQCHDAQCLVKKLQFSNAHKSIRNEFSTKPYPTYFMIVVKNQLFEKLYLKTKY